MIQVCDSIMGTGKSSAAITYMNEHPQDKFIYITPYLEEATRIRESCPDKKFAEPSDKKPEYHFKKSEHTAALIKEGRNIATTHQAFKMYTEEMLDDIRRYGYRLIIDESVEVLEKYDCNAEDIQIAIDTGYIKEEDDAYTLIRDDYNGQVFRELFRFLKLRNLIKINSESDNGKWEHLFYWVMPPELITSFQDVFILTYLFKGQSLHHFLEIYQLPYEYIGIQKDKNGTFRFCDYPGYTPEYVTHLGDMIHIVGSDKLNNVGSDIHALSMSWFDKRDDDVERLKKNIYNYANNIWRDIPANEKMWGTYKSCEYRIQGKGYTKSFVTFNTKATNAYRNRRYLMYLVNLFMNVGEKTFYQKHGVNVDEDAYALSIMVQWIWRSAIRDGDEIQLYIPSSRMRTLLINWIDKTSKGGNTVER